MRPPDRFCPRLRGGITSKARIKRAGTSHYPESIRITNYCLAAKVSRNSKKTIIFQKKLEMSIIGNLIWLVLGGLVVAIIYFVVGLLMCITIIGIPFGLQLFKLGAYALHPFGHELVNGPNEPGCLSVVMNLLWILCGWWEVAIIHLFCGLIFCVSIIGIPLGLKHFSMALASIFPFGKEIR